MRRLLFAPAPLATSLLALGLLLASAPQPRTAAVPPAPRPVDPASAAAVAQLKREGSYASLATAFRAAR